MILVILSIICSTNYQSQLQNIYNRSISFNPNRAEIFSHLIHAGGGAGGGHVL